MPRPRPGGNGGNDEMLATAAGEEEAAELEPLVILLLLLPLALAGGCSANGLVEAPPAVDVVLVIIAFIRPTRGTNTFLLGAFSLISFSIRISSSLYSFVPGATVLVSAVTVSAKPHTSLGCTGPSASISVTPPVMSPGVVAA
jgi:hypothetical protein